ncbi:MAG TPA: GGDEF domain-containing protein [Candidatus Binatia bacterium]|nr:GGDEF domain-containing protein [Candidatus Binatia bacterium]
MAGATVSVFIALDAVRSIRLYGGAGVDMAVVQLVELGVVALLMWLAARRVVRIEVLALALAVVVFGVRLSLLSQSPVSVAYLVTILAGTGLFLSWSSRWHAGWLVLAVGMTGAAGLLLPGSGVHAEVMFATVSAAVVSFTGQRLWQGRLRRMLEQQFELRGLSRYARRQEAHASELNRELNHVARRDSLTGVGNRRALDEAIVRLLDRGARLRPARFALVLFDIDHFKAYNDEHGHLAGDAALGHLGEILRRATRGGDHAFRYGGEEFVLLIPEMDLAGAMKIAERVRVAASEARVDGLPPITLSGGVALCDPGDGRDPEPLLRRADAALYLAKRAGRNRIAADELSVAMQRQELAASA